MLDEVSEDRTEVGSMYIEDVLADARSVHLECPGGNPRTLREFAAVYALSVWDDAAAATRIARCGCKAFHFDEDRKVAMVQAAKAHMEEALPPKGLAVAAFIFIGDTFKRVEARRSGLNRAAVELGTELAPYLAEHLTPDPHQLQAVVQMRRMNYRAFVADDMGLGKTIEALLGIIDLDRGHVMAPRSVESPFPAVVVCPASVTVNWRREIDTWLAKTPSGPPVVVPIGPKARIDLEDYSPSLRRRLVFVCTYDKMVGRMTQFRAFGIRTVVFDESHYLANRDGQRARAAMRLSRGVPYRILLTGTPMPNGRHAEMYAQLKVLDKDVFSHLPSRGKGDWKPFAYTFCRGDVRFAAGKMHQAFNGRTEEAAFGRIFSRFQIERKKTEVGMKIGSKTRYIVEVPMGVRATAALLTIRDEVAAEVKAAAHAQVAEMLAQGLDIDTAIDRAQSAGGASALTLLGRLRRETGRIKARWAPTRILEWVDQGERVLCFCKHYETAEILLAALRKRRTRLDVRVGTGSMTQGQRQRLVDDAQAGEGDVLILTGAFKEGITLTSFARGVMIERFWRPGDEMQMEDRIYRRGQDRDVVWDFLHLPGTTDDAMAEVLTWKERGQAQATGSPEVRVMAWLGLDRDALAEDKGA